MKKNTEYSREHILYLRNIRRKSVTVHVVRLAVLFLFLGIWELCADSNG